MDTADEKDDWRMGSEAYKKAGVDIDAQDDAIDRIKGHVKSTRTDAVLGDVGRFGGLFATRWETGSEPILVASADGVGTKLKIAARVGDYTTIGQCLVNHCVNDILVQGAHPLFFMDYVSMSTMDPPLVEGVVSGMAKACRESGCALLGGELAEMPGLYQPGDFDIAGFVVGQVDRSEVLPRETLAPGDVLLGLGSTGLHTNGYSLAIRVLLEDGALPLDEPLVGDEPLGRTLLAVHRCYLPSLRGWLRDPRLKGLAHITGGGLVDNLPRILDAKVSARIEVGTWPVPPIFGEIARRGEVSVDEAFRVFNLGIGLVAVVAADAADAIAAALTDAGEAVYRIGELVPGDGGVDLVGASDSLFEAVA